MLHLCFGFLRDTTASPCEKRKKEEIISASVVAVTEIIRN